MTRPARLAAWLRRLNPVVRTLVAGVGPITAIIGTLLALGIITPSSSSASGLADSIDKTLDAGTSRVVLRVRSDGGEVPARFTATGAFDYRAGRGTFTYDFSGTRGFESDTAVPARLDDHIVFIRFPAGSGVPRDRPWVRADLEGTDKLLRNAASAGALPASAPDLGVLADIGITDPSRVLSDLRDSGDVEDLGETTLFGRTTHRYRGTIGGAGGGGRVKADAWVGDGDLIQHLELAGDGRGGRVTASIDFTDYGKPVKVVLPPAERVINVSELLARWLAEL